MDDGFKHCNGWRLDKNIAWQRPGYSDIDNCFCDRWHMCDNRGDFE